MSTFTATSGDAAGNSATSAGFPVTLDTSTPNPVIGSISDDAGESGSDLVTNVTAQTVSGTAEAGSTVRLFQDGTRVATVTADGAGVFVADVALAEGANTFVVIAEDVAGNASGRSADFVVSLDTVAPTSQVSFPVEGDRYTWRTFAKGCAGGRDSAICGTATDAAGPYVSGVASVSLRLYRTNDGTCIDATGSFSAAACGPRWPSHPWASWEHDLGVRLSNGFYATTATVIDVAGNVTAHTVNFEIY